MLQINDKWLDFYASHVEVPCWLSRLASVQDVDTDMFSCDHVVADFYGLIFMELKDKIGGS